MSWIWLDENKYSGYLRSYPNVNGMPEEEREKYNYCVADFRKEYSFGKKIKKAVLTVSGDCVFRLFVNGEFIGIGPVSSGGDFLCRERAPKHYSNRYELDIDSETVLFEASVKLLSEKLTEYSRCRGGFMLEAELEFSDGEKKSVCTDGTWLCRRNTAYTGFRSFDSLAKEDEFSSAQEIGDIWNAEPAPIPMLSFNEVGRKKYTLAPGEKLSDSFELDRIYGVYPVVASTGKCKVKIETNELPEQERTAENLIFGGASEYRSFLMHSAGNAFITAENTDSKPVGIEYSLLASWYPVEKTGKFICSDEELNRVFDVCAHTLKICRQTIHLDSTKHQELLACTGDYYIESLMTLYIYGDMRLSELDVKRTADWLAANDGRMFHTTYSLIWVRMLLDVYMMTGNREMLEYSEKGLDALLARFRTYKGESGVIESPPDFMFVDWTVIDGYSMHHPPKALGQTVLNAFYYDALKNASRVYSYLNRTEKAQACEIEAADFRVCFNREFFDAEKGIFFDGKNDAYGGREHYIPENSSKRYYSKYPNILAALYGLTDDDTARSIIEKVIFNDEMQDIQPYFMHYMLCAVRRLGLFGKYGKQLVDRWKPVAAECGKGLKEGWIAPQSDYSFDHSHAWGGTVAYQLPSAVSGMKILEPGMKKLSFSPCLYWLESADILIPTRFGDISLTLRKGSEPVITAPDEIEIV